MEKENICMKSRNLILIPILIFGLGFLPKARALSPVPDGGYPGGNTAEGQNALFNLTTGTNNTAVGWFSLKTLTTGQYNTALGAGALFSTDTTSLNTATGAAALFRNTGNSNTANGALSLFSNTTGSSNTAVGKQALFENTTGGFNTAMGLDALSRNNGNGNTANGALSLFSNTTGKDNTAVGMNALSNNTTSDSNTAIGREALYLNSTLGGQTAVGYHALRSNSASGQFCFGNTAVGFNALEDSTDGCGNTAIGTAALGSDTSGSNNVAVGLLAGNNVTTASNVICIGTAVGANASNSCFIGSIWNQPGGSQAVYVNSDGKLGAQVSSRRFKDDIKPMEQTSEVIYGLKPVSFRYKPQIEPTRPVGFGLIAEDVEKISPDLVTRGGDGQVNSVRYDAVNSMLLNEFLKEHRRLLEQGATIVELKNEIACLVTTVKEQAAQIQKVSTQIELSKPAKRVVLNGQ
jgi:hypothetical protein